MNETAKIETFDPRLDVKQDVLLVFSKQREVAERPILLADLNVLPAREIAPKTADALATLQK